MKELLIRTISGLLMGIVLLACVFVSPWSWAALLLFIIAVGTFEMSRLQQMNSITCIIIGEALSLSFFALPALVALQVITPRWLLLEMLIALMPFLYALFSVKHDAKPIFTYLYASLAFLSLPSSLMLFM
jgi:CDP-diglyceride synthetase